MTEPCKSCDRRGIDFGGCRCQSFALTGDPRATDPACSLSPHHRVVLAARERTERLAAGASAQRAGVPRFLYRGRASPTVGRDAPLGGKSSDLD
jgi:pyrroloquinoline quinone biosynthesis protein E